MIEVWKAIGDGDWGGAIGTARGLLAQDRSNIEAVRGLAIALWAQGDTEAAIGALEAVVEASPADPLFWSDLGTLYFRRARHLEAHEAYRRSFELDSGSIAALHGCAEALLQMQRPREAMPLIEECLRREPDRELFRLGLVRCLVADNQYEAAEAVIDAQLAVDPRGYGFLLLKAGIASNRSNHHQALELTRAAVAVNPESFEALANLAMACWSAGDSEGAFEAQERALHLTPTSADLHACLLWLTLHDPNRGAAHILALYRASSRFWAGNAPVRTEFKNTRELERKLRVGYLSGEFVMNPAYCFLACWLQHQDREKFTSYYYMCRPLHSSHTDHYRKMADHWRDVWMLNDVEVAEQIERDGIDILVDLSGHFSGHRLSVFARRAAPVQVAFPHFPATTGVDQIDYLFSDIWTSPLGTESEYSEKLYRLPCGYIAFQLNVEAPEVTPLPAEAKGHLTFGLFQRPGKYHAEMWDAVGAILQAVPDSKLLIHYESAELDREGSPAQEHLLGLLAKRKVDGGRVLFRGARPLAEHLAVLAEADIALDSFPYNGQTTTCDCLWMGVPVINLKGNTHAARVGQGLLERVGLGEFSCTSMAAYRETAIRLSENLDELSSLRRGLRGRAVETLGDGARLAREIETAYKEFWREYVSGA